MRHIIQKKVFILATLLLPSMQWAQLEQAKGIRIGLAKEDETSNSTNIAPDKYANDLKTNQQNTDFKSLEKKYPLYRSIRDSLGFYRSKRPFSMNQESTLLDYRPEQAAPKWFRRDSKINSIQGKDQYLGTYTIDSDYVYLWCRDHEAVDGDLVRVFHNSDIIQKKVYLGSGYQKLKIQLQKGKNKIDIQALNQGMSGPNTADFKLYDDKGFMVASSQWNLRTGAVASFVIQR